MSTSLKLTPRKGDLLAVLLVILLAAGIAIILWLNGFSSQEAQAEIYRDGTLVKTLPLNIDQTFTVEGEYRNTVTVKGGKLAVTDSDCPNSDCVHSGWISRAGYSIVCLPNKVEIRLAGITEPSDVDTVTG